MGGPFQTVRHVVSQPRGHNVENRRRPRTLVHYRGLRVEPMEQRALLSVALQFDHVIYDPATRARRRSPARDLRPTGLKSAPIWGCTPLGKVTSDSRSNTFNAIPIVVPNLHRKSASGWRVQEVIPTVDAADGVCR